MKLCLLTPLIEGNSLERVNNARSSPYYHSSEWEPGECEEQFLWPRGPAKGHVIVKMIKLLSVYSEWRLRRALPMVSEGWPLIPCRWLFCERTISSALWKCEGGMSAT